MGFKACVIHGVDGFIYIQEGAGKTVPIQPIPQPTGLGRREEPLVGPVDLSSDSKALE